MLYLAKNSFHEAYSAKFCVLYLKICSNFSSYTIIISAPSWLPTIMSLYYLFEVSSCSLSDLRKSPSNCLASPKICFKQLILPGLIIQAKKPTNLPATLYNQSDHTFVWVWKKKSPLTWVTFQPL